MKNKKILDKELEVYYRHIHEEEQAMTARAVAYLKERGYEIWDVVHGKFE